MATAAPVIVMPDGEAAIIAVLNAEFAARSNAARAHSAVPNPRPKTFIRIMRTGGPRETLISENGSYAVESWSEDEDTAIANLNLARGILFASQGVVFGVTDIAGPTNLPDPLTAQIRWTSTMGVRTRGAAA